MPTRRNFLRLTSAAATGSLLTSTARPDAMSTDTSANDPIRFSAGLVADAQYADSDPKGTRFYRNSIQKLTDAVSHFNSRNLKFCLHLGDLIDNTWTSFDDILQPVRQSRHPFHQLLGNHDFEVADQFKLQVPQRMQMTARYSSFDQPGYRFLLLDSNDVSIYAWPDASEQQAAARAELRRLQDAGLTQAQSWNGGIGPRQLQWFDELCRDAAERKLKVVVFAHHPVFPDNPHNLWNSDQVLQSIDRHANIVAWFSGHNHAGNFGIRHRIPFVTLHGMVETRDTTAFATAEFLDDRIIITGHGREPSRELIFTA